MQSDDFKPLRLVLEPGGYGVELAKPDVVLGRHSQADVRLPMPDVSRRHCRFVCKHGQWSVCDLNSLNGIFVNGERVQRAELRQGDVIAIGGLTLVVNTVGNEQHQDPLETRETGEAILRSIADVLSPSISESRHIQRRAS